MELNKQNILYIARAGVQGGAENVVLQLCKIFKPLVNNVIVCAGTGFDQNALRELNVKFYPIPDLEKKDIGTIRGISSTLKRIVRDEKVTVIHTHHRMAAFYVEFLGLYKNCTFINTSHNTFNNRKLLTRYSYHHAHLIACGEMVKKNLTDVFGLSDVTVVHNAVEEFRGPVTVNEDLKQLSDDGFTLIGNVGRLTEQKGMEYFIDAAPAVLNKHPKTKFLIIGSGELEEALKQQVQSLDLQNSVLFLGFRHDIQNLISQLDFIVLSSLWEGLPLTPIEAYSVGKTVIGTAVDGTVEIIRDGIDGYLIPDKDSRAIADKCNELIEHPEVRASFEKKAKERYEDSFSFEVLSKAYIDYYRNL